MKKLGLLFSFLAFINIGAFSQGFTGPGHLMSGIGINFDTPGKYNYFNYVDPGPFKFPGITGYIEVGIHDYISLGPVVGFARHVYQADHIHTIDDGEFRSRFNRSGRGLWRITETWLYIGARGTFHFTPFINEVAGANIPEQLHLYSSLFIGYNGYYKNRTDRELNIEYPNNSTGTPVGILIGARYMFSENVGAFLELNANYIRAGTLGISFGV